MDLSDNYQFNYQKLFKFLSRPGNSGYLFAMADDYRFIHQINTSLVADLQQQGIAATILFVRHKGDESLVQQLNAAAMEAKAIMVANLYEIVNDVHSGHDQLLLLNFSREELRQIPAPMIFWVDIKSLNIITNQAPDLFSQRRFTTIHFTGKVEHPVEEVLLKEEWSGYVNTDDFKDAEAKIETLKRRLKDAEATGYHANRIAVEIALPLAREYATLGFTDKAQTLLEKYAGFLDSNNNSHLEHLAQVYHLMHQYPLAIETMQKANEVIEAKLHLQNAAIVYPYSWFSNTIALSDWLKEYSLPKALELLLRGVKELEDNLQNYANAWATDKLVVFYERLGSINLIMGKLSMAKHYYEHCLTTSQRLQKVIGDNERLLSNIAIFYSKLGHIAELLGDSNQAYSDITRCLNIQKELEQRYPHNEEFKRNLSITYSDLGRISQQLGDLDRSKEFYVQSLIITKQIATTKPYSDIAKRDVSVSLEKLGDISQEYGDLKDAMNYYQQSLSIRKELEETNPTKEEFKRDLSVSFNKIAKLLQQEGNFQEAYDLIQRGLVIRQKLERANPQSEQLKRDVAVSHALLGSLAEDERRQNEALEHYQTAYRVFKTLLDANPQSSQLQDDVKYTQQKIDELQTKVNPGINPQP